MKVKYQDTLLYKIQKRIDRKRSQIILSSDISDFADKAQISRALPQLVKQGKLVKLGYRVFAKPLFYSDRLNKPIIDFLQASQETLNKLKVKWELGKAAQNYNAGRSTQIPVKVSVKLKSRFSRDISYGTMKLRYE